MARKVLQEPQLAQPIVTQPPKPPPRIKLIIDLGNALVKTIIHYTDLSGKVQHKEQCFVHSMAIINAQQYEQGLTRAGTNDSAYSYIQVDGAYYVVGEIAESFQVEKRQGRSKYTEDYYVPFVLAIISQEFAKSPGLLHQGIDIMASHAPQDIAFGDVLINTLKRVWTWRAGRSNFRINVRSVETFDEPFGGYNNAGMIYRTNPASGEWQFPLLGSTVGIIDIGGGTISMLKVGPDGAILKADNGIVGINNALRAFEQQLLVSFPKYFANARRIPPQTLREAFSTGIYKGKGNVHGFDVSQQAETASVALMNELATLYITVLDDGLDTEILIGSGGGSGAFESRIKSVTQHSNFRLSDTPRDIHYSNIRGAWKLCQVLELMG